ncbi:alkaline phosphatase PhoX [uncultured Tenacibaculum sp.]|uniref:alkaline phosphatase PhoX n=1 Tax=uncultured Tenacibaculum sp. TaxID=174713 RepID=UPI0026063441|nr:alkaline phosphatase PhoX [uncultured Tenacibaculum sp.]
MKKIKLSIAALLALTVSFTTFYSCQDGENGVDGLNGQNGQDGQDGADGADGQNATAFLNESITPNFLKLRSEFASASVTPILSSEDVIPGAPDFIYGSMADGAGLLKNGNGTFTLINNIEADYSIARITLTKDLKPAKGEYILNAAATAETAQCSGSMITPEEHGFGPLYLSGGEWGGSSKGVFATNPYRLATDASTPNMLPALGQWSTENAVALHKDAFPGKTVVFIGDDQGDNFVPSGHLGMYVGDQGDLSTGKLYGLRVTTAGVDYEVDMAEGTEYDVEFVELVETEIAALDAECKAKGVMGFSRLEDIDWRRGSATNNREIYFAVTGRDKPDLVGKGTISGRIYKVTMNGTDPTGAGKITCVLDGDVVGGKAQEFLSPDNILVTENYAYIQEDPAITPTGNKLHYARLYQYNLTTGELKVVLECDQVAAAAQGYGAADRMWEITGMIDVTDLANNGENTFLLITQNHGWEPADGTSFTDPMANPDLSRRKEGSVLHVVTGLER